MRKHGFFEAWVGRTRHLIKWSMSPIQARFMQFGEFRNDEVAEYKYTSLGYVFKVWFFATLKYSGIAFVPEGMLLTGARPFWNNQHYTSTPNYKCEWIGWRNRLTHFSLKAYRVDCYTRYLEVKYSVSFYTFMGRADFCAGIEAFMNPDSGYVEGTEKPFLDFLKKKGFDPEVERMR